MTSKIRRSPPGPRGHFLFGSLRDFRRDLVGTVSRAHRRLGDVVRFRLGHKAFFVLSHPRFAERVFIDERENFVKVYEQKHNQFLALIFGKGIFTASGREWKDQRQMMQPVFQRTQILAMAHFMLNAGRRMVQRWEAKAASGEVVEITEEMSRLTMDVIVTSMFSADVLDRADELARDVAVVVRYVGKSFFNPLQPPLWFPSPGNLAFKRAHSRLSRLIYTLIDEHRANPGAHGDLLDRLLQARYHETGKPMPLSLVHDQVAGIFGAGHETTSCAMTWTWYLLGKHPEALKRLHSELDSVLQGREPCVEDLPNLPYTRMVLEESMRLLPPVPQLPRVPLRDFDANGFHVPAGSVVLVSFLNIHRHIDYWEEPDSFRPERFDPAANATRHRCAYLPFGVGPHVCLGSHFAMTEAQLLLAMLAQKFDVQLLPDQTAETEVVITLRPKHGLYAKLTPRRAAAVPAHRSVTDRSPLPSL